MRMPNPRKNPRRGGPLALLLLGVACVPADGCKLIFCDSQGDLYTESTGTTGACSASDAGTSTSMDPTQGADASTSGTTSSDTTSSDTTAPITSETSAPTAALSTDTYETSDFSCGDGHQDEGEECDDGNQENTDACLNNCTKATCGDGHVQAGVEECDPGDPESPYCDPDDPDDPDDPVGCKKLVAVAVAAGGNHTCALLRRDKEPSIHRVRCWGSNGNHQLGYTTTNLNFKEKTPRTVYKEHALGTGGNLDLPPNVAQVVAGPGKTCFILDTGLLRCTGYHTCDFAASTDDSNPKNGAIDLHLAADLKIPNYPNHEVTALSIGEKHTCATLTKDGSDKYVCWQEELGVTDSCSSKGESCPDKPDFQASTIATCDPMSPEAGCSHASGDGGSCYIEPDGYLKCWGKNTNYAEGGQTAGQEVPVCAGALQRGIVHVAAGPYHYCAIEFNMDDQIRKVFCWGSGGVNDVDGRLGPGSTKLQKVADSTAFCLDQSHCSARQLALGHRFSCALSSDNELYCWGTLCSDKWLEPKRIDLPDGYKPIGISAGRDHICTSSSDHGIFCAGSNDKGQTGQLDTSCSTEFSRVNL